MSNVPRVDELMSSCLARYMGVTISLGLLTGCQERQALHMPLLVPTLDELI